MTKPHGSTSSEPAQPQPPIARDPRQERNARIAVTIFPLLVLAGGIIGFAAPGTFTPMAAAVPWLLGVVMFFMGLTLTLPDFTRIAKRPWVVLIGLAAQYIIMPLAGLLVATALGLPPELAVGVILVGCAPGGTASNVVTYLGRGDVALSVTITTCSTLLAPLLTPILTLWLAGQFMEVSAAAMMMSIVKTVFVPVVAGVLIRALAGRLVDRIMPVLPWLSTLAITLIVAIVVAGSAGALVSAGLLVIAAVILHNCVGLGMGYAVGRLTGLSAPERRALTFEVGLQNSGLAATLAATYFSPLAALPGAVFSVWHNVSGAVMAAFFARRAD
ncbi:bile acid:sodium symporter family protein [Brevibacterium otitidis]|uniref:Bile acid:sodium symporter family protein n=1 Tax=Brevibacterium otitidis TaxID=53364 RepID=A0ABV5X5G2_9MICO|nr:bile acid:sodium symporter family protein [Brevibacterium otitidis]